MRSRLRSLFAASLVAAGALLACGSASAQANPTTPVTATQMRLAGALIPAGSVTMTLVDAKGTAVSFTTADGTFNGPQGFPAAITNGVLASGFAPPDQCTSANVQTTTPLSYQVIVTKTTAPSVSYTFVIPPGVVCGSSAFALDHYTPAQIAVVTPAGLGSGTALPNGGKCTGSGFFYVYSGTAVTAEYECVAGQFRPSPGGSGGGASLPGTTALLKGNGSGGALAATPGTDYPTVASVTSNANAISAETTRATAAETANTNAINTLGTPTGIATALGYTPAQSAQVAGEIGQNVLADYNVFPGTGTTLPDTSGNHNDGTFIGAPTWGQNSLFFPQNTGVQLPSAVNATRSVIWAGCVPVLGTYANYITMISSSLGSSGFNLIANMPQGGVFGQVGIWSGGISTQPVQQQVGCHIWGVVFGGGTPDRLYVDGVEQTYVTQGTTAVQPSGYLAIGTSVQGPWAGGGLFSTFYRARFYSSQLSAAGVLAATNLVRGYLANVGIVLNPVIPHPTAELIGSGDSIMAGTGATNGHTWLGGLSLTNWPAYTPINLGIGGTKEYEIAPSNAVRIAPRCGSPLAPTTALLSAGTNDMGTYSSAAAFASGLINSLALDIRQLKAAGCRVAVATLLDRGEGTPGAPTSFTGEAGKDAANPVIRSMWRILGADLLIDFGAVPELGADGAAQSSTYFGDKLHPTDAGYTLMSAAASNALNVLAGSNETSPTVVTGTAYTMTARDTYVSANVSGNAVINLPSCVGQSGTNYRINNSTSFQIRLQTAIAYQTINGTDYSTTGLLTTGPGTVTLRDVPNSASAGGCHWEM